MRKAVRVLGRVFKAALIIGVAAAGRISRGQGEGVIEEAIQNAIYDVATYYVRKVRPA